MTGGARLREAARDNRLGRPEKVYSKAQVLNASEKAKRNPSLVRAGTEKWCEAVLQNAETAQIGYEEILEPWPIVTTNGDTESYFFIQLKSDAVAEEEGFGDPNASDESNEGEEVNLVSHSLVCCETGNIYSVDPGNKPDKSEGIRGNVLDVSSFANALNKNSGRLELFGDSVAALILSVGVDINSPNCFGETALMQAAVCGHTDLCRWLITDGKADVNACMKSGATALLLSVEKGSSEHDAIIEMLVAEGGANINHANAWGKTALHISAFRGNLRVSKLLVKLGADKGLRDLNGKVPGDYTHETTCERGSDDILRYSAELETFLN